MCVHCPAKATGCKLLYIACHCFSKLASSSEPRCLLHFSVRVYTNTDFKLFKREKRQKIRKKKPGIHVVACAQWPNLSPVCVCVVSVNG